MAGSGFENDSGRYSPLPFEFVLADFEDLPACNDEETKIMLQQAVRVFLTLHQSYEPVDLKEVLVRIKTLLKNDIVRKYLEENQIHLSVLGTLKHLATHCDIQKICCELFSEFLEYNIVTMESIAHCDILKYVIHGLYDNIFDADMLKNGMKIFARVLSSAAVRDQLLLDGQLEKILDLLTIAVTAYREVTDIQIHLFISLQNLLMDDVELQEIFINKQLVFSVEVLLANKSKPNVVREILKLYEILTKKRHGFVQNLIEEHIHLHVLDLIRSFKDDESLIEVAFRLLTLLNKQDRVQKTIVLSGFASDTLFPLMLKLPYNDDLQYSGLKILYTLAHILILESNDITCEWVHVIYVGMCKHRDKKHVQVAGCKALYRLLQLKPDASHWIGEDLMLQKQDPVHNLCLGALLMYIHDRQIFVHACEALFWLSADNERLCTLFRNKNAYIAVTEGLKIHMSDAKAVETACRALRGLCIFHDDNKHAVSMDGVLSLLTSVLIRFPQEELVQIEAISVIACLADVDNVRHQCFVDHVHDIVMATLRAFPSNVLLQEVGLEALAVLAGAANGAEMLISLGALFIISTAMSNFQDIICIQKKALIVLQLLANDCASDGPDLCRELAKLTICAMSKYPDDVGIQLECCVAVQLMAESSGMMSELFVEFGCHELLFLILENFTEKKGLQDLASECLCVLTLEQNLKSSMLLSACSRCVLSVRL